MGYYVADANGYIADIASIGGWRAFRAWSSVDPIVRDFVITGVTETPATLAQALLDDHADDPDVESIRSALYSCAEAADAVLILSDGSDGRITKGLKYNHDHDEAGRFASHGGWTNPHARLASEVAGVTPNTPITTQTLYHVTKAEHLDAILRDGFSLRTVRPRYVNDLAVSLTAGSARNAADYFTDGKPLPEKYALLEVTVRGRMAPADVVADIHGPMPRLGGRPEALSPKEWRKALIATGHDGFHAGGQDGRGHTGVGGHTVFVHNLGAITRIRHIQSPKAAVE